MTENLLCLPTADTETSVTLVTCPLIVRRDTVTRDHVPHQHLRVGDHGAVPAHDAASGPRRYVRHRRGAQQDRHHVHQVSCGW